MPACHARLDRRRACTPTLGSLAQSSTPLCQRMRAAVAHHEERARPAPECIAPPRNRQSP
eukprot:1826900-Prymnesium_polylepis.1